MTYRFTPFVCQRETLTRLNLECRRRFTESRLASVASYVRLSWRSYHSCARSSTKSLTCSFLEGRHYLQQHPANLPQWWRCKGAAFCETPSGRLTLVACLLLFLFSRAGSGDTGKRGICYAVKHKWMGCSKRSSWQRGDWTPGWRWYSSSPGWRSLCPGHGSGSPPVE